LEAGCDDCHTIAGLSQGQTGPELTNIGVVAVNRRPGMSAEDYIRESFLIPNAFFVEGYEPDSTTEVCGGPLSELQLNDVVAFLLSQQ
jgi:hypothetical protein